MLGNDETLWTNEFCAFTPKKTLLRAATYFATLTSKIIQTKGTNKSMQQYHCLVKQFEGGELGVWSSFSFYLVKFCQIVELQIENLKKK
jgi:hypothetical protein